MSLTTKGFWNNLKKPLAVCYICGKKLGALEPTNRIVHEGLCKKIYHSAISVYRYSK